MNTTTKLQVTFAPINQQNSRTKSIAATSHLVNGRARRSARAEASDFQGKPVFFQPARLRAQRRALPRHFRGTTFSCPQPHIRTTLAMKSITQALALAALASGCAVGPNYRQPTTAVPATYKSTN